MQASLTTIDCIVGGNVRQKRWQRSVSLAIVAELLGTTPAAIGEKEAGLQRFSASDLQRLCALLEVRPADLYADVR